MTDSTKTYSYDEVPYPNNPFLQSHPDRLATIARLFGMEPKPIDDCRVLELGSGRGGNLIPMAEQMPHSQFVGVELSRVQQQEATEFAKRAQLSNIEFKHMNILDFGADAGEFDYILSHGVFSWVPTAVQEHILEICHTNLAPQGVAYVSYNTYPGWNMRGMIRDIMCYHASAGRFGSPQARVLQGRGLLDFLSQNTPDNNAFGMLLKSEVELIRCCEDGYLYHEHFEEVNDPIYFHEFNTRLQKHQLQYMGESDAASMYAGHLPGQVVATLQRIATDLIQMEQYMDFVKNRTFRQTLMCHANVKLDRALKPGILNKFHVASPLAPEGDASTIRTNQQVKFQCRTDGRNGISSMPLVKAAMFALADVWPASLSFPDLVTKASRMSSSETVMSSEQRGQMKEVLGRVILEWYLGGILDLHTQPACFAIEPTATPHASRVTQLQAETGSIVTTLAHDRCGLSDLGRYIVRELDGRQTVEQVVDKLLEYVRDGSIIIQDEACGPNADPRPFLAAACREELQRLGRMALLLPVAATTNTAKTKAAKTDTTKRDPADSDSSKAKELSEGSKGEVLWEGLYDKMSV